ncbi:hypothetical protein [Pseudomonas phage PA1C]|uniref:Uncharacterized protein n=1 Tax=Pseudomonas phage vB_PaeM_PS119XW TaxID=2601632 RepID=A0A5C1K9X6_9CAUD|nr:hypothetical protein PP933_gp380 [Pseudomonas phage vB_PaeM_PS119XW]QBX32543.1 hypothetical protein [Pseudomonas phage PA1C]QEM42114.1 hypothetical protein [Pseudomonas phage vB_PaeM_PS119XW]
MNIATMFVLAIHVGLFGITSTEESTIQFENKAQCISRLDILENKYRGYEILRTENTLKVTNPDEYSIFIFKCL